MKVCSVDEMKELDQRATKEFGITQELLMENAGEATYFVILKALGVKDKRFGVFCGIGNNGGDACVVARKLHSNNGWVKIYLLGDKSKFTGAAKKNFEIISKLPIEIQVVRDLGEINVHELDAIVDGIFGTGLVREVGGIYKSVIELINSSGKPIFSIDIPSGVNGDTGEIMGSAVKADWTVTFGLPKIGNILYPGYAQCGKLYLSHISFPPSLYKRTGPCVELNTLLPLPERKEDSHKGNYGKVLFVAGSTNYLGAPYFSALSFLKAGGGLAWLATPKSISPFIATKGSEIVFLPQKETETGSLAIESKSLLLEWANKADMVVIGPGLSLNDETQNLVRELAPKIKPPLLIDGDGLTAIANNLELIKKRGSPTILTPHFGEMSRITGIEISEIKRNRVEILKRKTQELHSIIILKGAHSLIGYPDGSILINTSGNSGMATAGSGDVLVGTIAGMFGLGLAVPDAVRMGVFMHGLAGDLAAKEKGEDGMTAQDILDFLPFALKYYREKFTEISSTFYNTIYVI